MIRHAIRMLVVLSLVSGAGDALADPAEDEARRLFDQATLALQTGRVAEARDLLRRSMTLYPTAATAFNLAVALRGTGETTESVELFTAILSGRHGVVAPEQEAEAARLRDETLREIAHVEIRATGAERTAIRVDGQPAASLPDGGTARIPVDAGAHEIDASAPGRVPARRLVRLDRGGHLAWNVHLELAGPHGTLIVEAPEPGATVEIVGVARGPAPLRHTVPAGERLVRAGDVEERIEVPAGATVRIRLDTSGSGSTSPWLWVGIGGLVAGAVLATALIVAGGGEADPVEDEIFGVVEALTIRP